MKPIPLINAEHAVRIADLLDAEGIPADRYLERSRLSPEIREKPCGFLPGRSVWALVGAVEEGEGLGDFWLDMAREGRWRRAGWIRPLTHAVTLGDALRAMCRSYVRQIPMNRLGLAADRREAFMRDVCALWERETRCSIDEIVVTAWDGPLPL